MATVSLAQKEAYERMCAGKEQFPSESAATAALRVYRKSGLMARAETIRAYDCLFCDFWHLGH